MCPENDVAELFISAFKKLARGSPVGDGGTNPKGIPAPNESVPIFACRVVLYLGSYQLRGG